MIIGRKNKDSHRGNVSMMNSVKTRLVLVMMIVCIVPMAVSMIINYHNFITKALDDAETKNLKQAAVLREKFDNVVNQNLRTIEGMADNPMVQEFIEQPESERDYDTMSEYLQKLNAHLVDVNTLAIIGGDGQQLIRTDGECINLGEREYFKKAIAGTENISNVIVSKSTDTRIIAQVNPVYNASGNAIGVTQRNYDVTRLHEFLVEAVKDDPGQEAFIVDNTGVLVAHSEYDISAQDDPVDYSERQFFVRGETEEKGSYVNTNNGTKYVMSFLKDQNTNWIVVIATDYYIAMSAAQKSAYLSLISGIIMLIIAIALSLYMAKSFTEPIKAVNTGISLMADGKFEHINKFADRKDEFGEIVSNTNAVIDKLGEIIHNIQQSAGAVNKSSDELSVEADNLSGTTSSVSEAVKDIASGANQQAEEIQHITESVGEIGEATANVKQSTDQLSDITARMQNASTESATSLSDLQKSSMSMSSSISNITEKVSATGNAVEGINNKVEEIAGIATQTNLLSLNASIEAARAGEAGRGFAVVAEEIGKLADDSRMLADSIRKEMDILLEESQSAVTIAAEVQKENTNQQKVLGATVQSVEMMIEDISSTAESVQSIEADVDKCISSKDVVADAMASLSAVSEENAASSSVTEASVEQITATTNTLADSAKALKDIAQKLNKDMSFFK